MDEPEIRNSLDSPAAAFWWTSYYRVGSDIALWHVRKTRPHLTSSC